MTMAIGPPRWWSIPIIRTKVLVVKTHIDLGGLQFKTSEV
jgi:hypothetical protein